MDLPDSFPNRPHYDLVENLLNISIALSAEKDHNRLLEMILTEARRITNADAGTLYLLEKDCLVFKILHNTTMDVYLGGKGENINIPPVKLSGENVSAYVAITGKPVNIPDVYHAEGFDFSGPRNYDRITGYRTRSMLVVPMENHESEIIGVLQLINSMEEDNRTVRTFPRGNEKIITALASQAAVSLTNARLISDIENLFDSFVQVTTTAIDAQTPYNANHTRRVANLAGALADAINDSGDTVWVGKKFTPDKRKQLVMAGWLHDIGKVSTPLSVMNKATRLEGRIELVIQRFEYIYQAMQTAYHREKAALTEDGSRKTASDLEAEYLDQLAGVKDDLETIKRADKPSTFIDDAILARLQTIAGRTYADINGETHPYLTPEELECLSVRKGTLTERERTVMEDHVAITARMLEKIPFIKKYAGVPVFAPMHHEQLDGKGYPCGLTCDNIPLEARILAMVDIYDALTAMDRPYKKAMPVDEALKIIGFMVRDGKLDAELFDLFKASRPWEKLSEQ